MADVTNAELLRRIEDLENENELLRVRGESSATVDSEPTVAPSFLRKKRGWAWTLLATVLITLGALVAPLAVVASWARVVLTDTDRFVAAYAPLADDPRIQAYVTDQTLDVINEHVDVEQITNDVIDGVTDLGTGPAATRALELLKGPAAAGIDSLIRTGVSNFVESDAFADVWESALRVSHAQVTALLDNDPDAVVSVSAEGEVGIQLGPIVDAVQGALVDQGIGLASRIPPIDRTIVVAQSDSLPTVRLAYGLAVAGGTWLPWVALFLLAAGVLVARRRPLALVWAAIALALSMAATALALAIGDVVFVSSVSPSLLPSGVAGLLYDTVGDELRATTVGALVLAIVVALVGWFAGPFEAPRRLRGVASEAASRLRAVAERRGISTGRAGEWMYLRRGLLRAIVAVIGAGVVLFVRPLTPGLTIWTLVIGGVIVLILELLQRPVITVPADTVMAPSVSVAE